VSGEDPAERHYSKPEPELKPGVVAPVFFTSTLIRFISPGTNMDIAV